MATVVVGTAGHIDHGKTALLRALTGIDADRLPEERRRGMTIDVGFAHLEIDDGAIDFVDVPGHDRLVGNMLVGAGEIDAALLVVAADDGPRPQTREHLALLDALGIDVGVVAITKADLVEAARIDVVGREVDRLLTGTSLASAVRVVVSAATGDGVDDLRVALRGVRDAALGRVGATAATTGMWRIGPRLAIDRTFSIKGRGTVVTGTLRGGRVEPGMTLDIVPGGGTVRVREVQVHNRRVDAADGGRTALNVAGDVDGLRRGVQLVKAPPVVATDRLLARLAPPIASTGEAGGNRLWPPAPRSTARLHLLTDAVEVAIDPVARAFVELDADRGVVALLRLAAPVAAAIGDRGVVRDPSSGDVVAGAEVLDVIPPRGLARRRMTLERLMGLAAAVADTDQPRVVAALADLHGALAASRVAALAGPPGSRTAAPELAVAADVASAASDAATLAVTEHHDANRASLGLAVADARQAVVAVVRRRIGGDRAGTEVAKAVAERAIGILITEGRLVREGDRLRDPAHATASALDAPMDRLEAALDVVTPPGLAEAARTAGCPPDGIRELEAAKRIVRVEDDLAWSTSRFHRLAGVALELARRSPLTPAALRDATGASRRYVMPLLEELGRRGILRRTDAGHVPGPHAQTIDPGSNPAPVAAER